MRGRSFEDEASWVEAVLAEVWIELERASREGRPADLVFAGGRTPELVYAALARAWQPSPELRIWLSDERCVPASSPERNASMVMRSLGDSAWRLGVRLWEEGGAESSAASYARALRSEMARKGASADPTMRFFDLALLGVGPDGHVASIFPGDRLSRDLEAVTGLGNAPSPPHGRVSLGLGALRRCGRLIYLLSGQEKAPIAELLAADDGSARSLLPALVLARLVEESGGTAEFLYHRPRSSSLSSAIVPP